MKRKIMVGLLSLAVLLCTAAPALAQTKEIRDELLEESGAQGLYAGLDSETRELLREAGIDGPTAGSGANGLLAALGNLLRERLTGPFSALAALVALTVLCRLGGTFGTSGTEPAVSLAGSAAAAAVAAVPILSLMETVERAVETAGAFLLAAAPVYTALLIASGNGATGGSYSFLTLAAGNMIPLLSSGVIFPLLRVLLALALTASVSQVRLDKLVGTVFGFAKWLLVISVSVFSGILSVQTTLNAQIDAAGAKTAKLFASAALPIVGSALGDAVTAVKNSVDLVKSGVGAFGILAVICLLAPAVIQAFLWSAVCAAGQIAGDLFEAPRISAFLGACANIAKMLLAVLVSTGVVAVASAAILLFVRSSL